MRRITKCDKCNHVHIATPVGCERKTCKKCNKIFQKNNFNKNSRNKDGFDAWCRECRLNNRKDKSYILPRRKIITCKHCSRLVKTQNSIYCSRSCFKENKNEKGNINWKGDNVGYNSLHEWIRNRKQKPEFCEYCAKKQPTDLANISQKYKRDVNDFEWLCRKCHMKKDGRLEIFIKK